MKPGEGERWWTERADAPWSNGEETKGGEGGKGEGCWDKKAREKTSRRVETVLVQLRCTLTGRCYVVMCPIGTSARR